MSARAIWEATGKGLINGHLGAPASGFHKCRFAVFDENTKWEDLVQKEPWLESEVSYHIFFKKMISKFHLMDLSLPETCC